MTFDAAKIALVLLGGAFGTGCRYLLSTGVYAIVQKPLFPWANMIINVSGSFAIGLLVQLFDTRLLVSPAARAAILTGVLGGYTTFSSFAFETYTLMRDGEFGLALANALGSVLLGLAAVWAGVRVAQTLW